MSLINRPLTRWLLITSTAIINIGIDSLSRRIR